MEWPQPSPWGNATTPSTFGGKLSPSKLRAISSAVCAAQLLAATTMEEAQALLIQLNDIVIAEVAFIPIILRPFFNAVSNRLRVENIGNENGYASPYWNIANWNLAEGQ